VSSSRDKLLKQFRELVGERLEKIGRNLMDLESGPNPDAAKNALRELHGLKGEARMMGFADINKIVHEMEGVLRAAEPRGFALTGGSADALLVASDAVLVLSGAQAGAPPEVEKLVAFQRTAAESGTAPSAVPEPEPPEPTTHGRGRALVELEGEDATTTSGRALPISDGGDDDERTARGRAMVEATQIARKRPEVRTDGSVRIGQQSLEMLTTSVTNLIQLARRRELAASRRLQLARELAQIARIAEDLGPVAQAIAARLNRAKEAAAELHREGKLLANEELRDLTQIREEVQTMRMMPLSVLFEPYPRMVRDLARELGKEVELSIEGEDTKCDRSVIESLRDPVLHLVRNALDHGLETREERVESSKNPRGHLSLRAAREGERILIRVEDDGIGLDPALLRKAAVKKGILDEAAAAALSDASARDLIFIPGFSSKDQATDVSGRGIGLDVVRVRMQGLGGDITLQSVVGRGSIFELRVPVSLTVAPLLFIQVGDEQLCLTASHVVNALKVEPDQVREMAGRPALKVQDEVLPFASIASILGMAPERGANEGELVLLVRGQGSTAAISVDRVLEERVQAILPLKGMLSRFKHLSGATPLADGSLAMVLSASHLISSAQGVAALRLTHTAAAAGELRKRRILVVDDSPLTRELISSLLEAVGYEIVNAADGSEAFDRLQRESVDMVVTDLEMPRMDGLELTRRLKSHATLRSLPVVIITTRGGDADRRRGMEAGADGYIAKGDLVRQDLVDVVARLLG
jgi:two-component system, chemotaxis family, sensor kinase CheA